MSRNARIEEVSDSDSDPDITDISTITAPAPRQQQPRPSNPSNPSNPLSNNNTTPSFDPTTAKHWICLYPLYFDALKSRQEGRRVGLELAVENPLARTLADGCASLGLKCFFEPSKVHPRDWGNVGRVKVELKGEGVQRHSPGGGVKNKHHLYILIAKYLQNHPTTPKDPLSLPIRGLPMPKEPLPPPAAPRGWKLNTILPMHSPAVTGGGVSENMLKDMMEGMGGAGGAGLGGPGGMDAGQMAQMQQLASMMGGMGGGDDGAAGTGSGAGGSGKVKKPKMKMIRG